MSFWQSFIIDWVIIGIWVFAAGALAGSRPTKSWALTFIGVVIFWPVSFIAFLVGAYKLVRGIIKTRFRRAK